MQLFHLHSPLIAQLIALFDAHSHHQQQPIATVVAQVTLRLREFVAKQRTNDDNIDQPEDEEAAEDDHDGDVGDGHNCRNRDGEGGRTLWKRIRTLVEFGLATDPRLVPWLSEMVKCSLQLSDGTKMITKIADRLQWVALRLALHSLPSICSPQIDRAPSLSNYCSSADVPPSVIFQSETEVTSRMDIAGGWTDTPPITYQCATPPAVLNVSIKVNGKRPIRCRCARLEQFSGVFYTQTSHENTERTLHFPSADSVFACCSRPSKIGSLVGAILLVAGIVHEELVGGERIRRFSLVGPGSGLYISTNSGLPHGSGLGTSSILSAAVLAALWHLYGKPFRQSELVHAVLRVEQLHTTGGGWQDQVGGCVPGGFKLGTVCPTGQRQCQWRTVAVSDALRDEMSKRLALIYTGRTRLAKHLLEEVLLCWLGRDERILSAVRRLGEDARRAERELREGKFPSQICGQYNELKKEFTAETEPRNVAELRSELTTNGLTEVAWVAGAGGGGFLYVWMRNNRTLEELKHFLASDERWKGMSMWMVQMEEEQPMLVKKKWTKAD